jgi:glycolate oxidase FAD binding subunit
MTVSSPALRDALADIVGGAHVVSGDTAPVAAAVDGKVPRWVVRAGSAEEVSRLLALASSERLAVTPRGSGSSLGLGNPPRRLDLVLDLSRLAGVTEYAPEDMVASVGAGTTLAAIGAALSPHRQRLALDPLGGESRTIGGVLASHASGPLRHRYGTGRDLLLGVRFVQADGTLTWGGAKVVKSVTGYDVPKLLVGSLGTLGVIVGATLRLHPVPPATGSWLCSFGSADAAQGFLAALLASPVEPDRVAVINAIVRRICGWPGPGPAVLVSVGSVDEAVSTQGGMLADLAAREGGEARPVPPEAWRGLGAALDAPVVLKLAGEIRRIMAWLVRAEALAARSGTMEVGAVGQGGNGTLQLALQGATTPGALGPGLLEPLREEVGKEGGSVVVERAPSSLKAGLDAWGPLLQESLEIMKRVKLEFDPIGILNPGRFVGAL